MAHGDFLLLAPPALTRRPGSIFLLHGPPGTGKTLLAKALQECPSSGLLWAEDIRSAPRAGQRRKVEDALHRCGDDPYVVVEVARFFAGKGRYAKARKWFKRAVTLDPSLDPASVEALLHFAHAPGNTCEVQA